MCHGPTVTYRKHSLRKDRSSSLPFKDKHRRVFHCQSRLCIASLLSEQHREEHKRPFGDPSFLVPFWPLPIQATDVNQNQSRIIWPATQILQCS